MYSSYVIIELSYMFCVAWSMIVRVIICISLFILFSLAICFLWESNLCFQYPRNIAVIIQYNTKTLKRFLFKFNTTSLPFCWLLSFTIFIYLFDKYIHYNSRNKTTFNLFDYPAPFIISQIYFMYMNVYQQQQNIYMFLP
jgi:hypothetical protein